MTGATAADAEASEVLADGFSRVMRSKLSESFEVQFERVSALVWAERSGSRATPVCSPAPRVPSSHDHHAVRTQPRPRGRA
jgi:hypothetical protein